MRKQFFSILSLLLIITIFVACGEENKQDNTETNKTEQANDKAGPEYTSAYICPMHCKGSGSDKAGKCGDCKMDLVENKGETEHDHDHNHEGHDHNH